MVSAAWYRKIQIAIIRTMAMVTAIYPRPAFGLTIKQEEDLSREFMRMARRQFTFVTDPCVDRWVNKVGNRLLSVLPPQPFGYHFFVIKDEDYNAFASPAGHIFVNSGLIAGMETEDELAGILAHEIAHAGCRHISENIDRSKKLQLASLAGLAGGILLGVAGAGALSQGVMAGTMAGTQSAALAYSREDEMQADQVGLVNLEKAGYNPEGLLSAMEKIREKDWFGGESPAYLSTPGSKVQKVRTKRVRHRPLMIS